MSSPYDQALLADAPAATKAQIQGGYNTDILQPSRVTPPISGGRDVERGLMSSSQDRLASRERLASKERIQPVPPPKVPFWRTTKGVIIMAIAAIVVIAAVIGGAVGGTKNRKQGGVLSNLTSSSSSPSSSSTSVASNTSSSAATTIASNTSSLATTTITSDTSSLVLSTVVSASLGEVPQTSTITQGEASDGPSPASPTSSGAPSRPGDQELSEPETIP